MSAENCFICQINKSKKFMVFATEYWQVDKPADINFPGLFFIKTKRHVEFLERLNKKESQEIGGLIRVFAKKSKKINRASRIITLSLGLKHPHVHFWLMPITSANKRHIQQISKALKAFADDYRN